ncbi:hypothetical protein [Microbacterium lacus]|uniref:hypothetical protein n=1 Tax=Microbacterium lacus TaxID=415217 RepID=UPI000C2CA9DC|nr:hypothetical protein [Microbacterium lacus]
MSLRDEILAVRDRFGRITPANVVEAARDDESPLHSRFEWDDTVAGARYREVQASELIRKVKITYAAPDGTNRDVRAFLALRETETTSAYVPTEEALSDPFTEKLLLQQFEREWKAFRSRYEHLRDFAATIARDIAA